MKRVQCAHTAGTDFFKLRVTHLFSKNQPSLFLWNITATPPTEEVETKPISGGRPLHNSCYNNSSHYPTMHWYGEEGCAGAAVTALAASRKLLCVCAHESETERERCL